MKDIGFWDWCKIIPLAWQMYTLFFDREVDEVPEGVPKGHKWEKYTHSIYSCRECNLTITRDTQNTPFRVATRFVAFQVWEERSKYENNYIPPTCGAHKMDESLS